MRLASRAFVYLVSRLGVTGTGTAPDGALAAEVSDAPGIDRGGVGGGSQLGEGAAAEGFEVGQRLLRVWARLGRAGDWHYREASGAGQRWGGPAGRGEGDGNSHRFHRFTLIAMTRRPFA